MQHGFVWTRRLAVALAVVMLSLLGHAAADGAMPSPVGLLLAVLVGLGLASGTRARMPLAQLTAVVLGGQALMHLLFAVSGDCGPHGSGSAGLVPSGSMLAGHLVASIAVIGLLRHGDRVLLAWTTLLTSALGVLVEDSCLVPCAAGSCPGDEPSHVRLARLAHAPLSRRGPPTA